MTKTVVAVAIGSTQQVSINDPNKIPTWVRRYINGLRPLPSRERDRADQAAATQSISLTIQASASKSNTTR